MSLLISLLVTFTFLTSFVISEQAQPSWPEDDDDGPFAIKFSAIGDSITHPIKWLIMDCFTTRNVTEDFVPGDFWIPCSKYQTVFPRMEMMQLMHTKTEGNDPIQTAISSQLLVITNTDIVHTVRNFVRYSDETHTHPSIRLPENFDLTNSSWSDFSERLNKQPWEATPEHPSYLRMMLTHPTYHRTLIHPAKEIDPITNFCHHHTELEVECGRDSKDGWDVNEIRSFSKINPLQSKTTFKITPWAIADNIFDWANTEMKGCTFIWEKTKRSKSPISPKRIEFFREHLRDKLLDIDYSRLSICVRNIKDINEEKHNIQIDLTKKYNKCTQCKKNPFYKNNNCEQERENHDEL